MSRSNSLKQLIKSKLLTVCNDVYFETASEKALYPHCVFDFNSINLDDIHRDDVILTVDVWDRGTSTTVIENLCDDIEDMFNSANLPQTDILPTFFKLNRFPVLDEDKRIRHRVLKFQIQNYER